MSVMDETFEETRARLRAMFGREGSLDDSVDNMRTVLRMAVQEAFGRERRTHVYLEDFGDDWLVFDRSIDGPDGYTHETLRIGYEMRDGAVVLRGEPQPVHPRVDYVEDQPPERARAFKTEANGKTLITAPATAFLEKAASPNPMFLNIMGRFVGGEKANRNGAFWSTDDLVFGQPSVKHGPLNWLHEERHIVGAITEAALLLPPETAADSDLDVPYIAAAAAMWRWLWPQEAAVVEMAAAQNRLWYSMECVSETVVCHGEGGCGTECSYMDALLGQGDCCDHIRERSTERRFKDPTFLGGAIIVPPVRPGWADANATLMSEAAKHTERAFEQAGQPDVEDGEWERLMAQVMAFAGVK